MEESPVVVTDAANVFMPDTNTLNMIEVNALKQKIDLLQAELGEINAKYTERFKLICEALHCMQDIIKKALPENKSVAI